jgi:glycerol dehydrogenase
VFRKGDRSAGERVAKANGSDLIIAACGGKVIDTGKVIGHETNIPVIIAATDAPCSALSCVYWESGVFERDMVLLKNPDCVLVDTILVSGLGHALATYWEPDTCAKNCKPKALTGACPFTLSSSCAGSTLLCHIDGIRPSSEAGCGK